MAELALATLNALTDAEAWEWAAALRDDATRQTVEAALAAEGVDGLVDLALAGPAFGGVVLV